jgi:hypothetical protein
LLSLFVSIPLFNHTLTRLAELVRTGAPNDASGGALAACAIATPALARPQLRHRHYHGLALHLRSVDLLAILTADVHATVEHA